uniref:KAP family P-loop domain-containing protein n=1 Tax=Candidatus Kentrum sp. FW TaxID=2126338 RepID=A0A450S6H5_9GAMM|nr:MAG: KAP family P-loop domain-containing protein [Candidatus Kentron sp. FW]
MARTSSSDIIDPKSPHYRNDLWTLDDDFSLGRAGDQVARMALEVEPPFTLGVTGKWGAGKTSVMRRAFATLGGQPIRQERTLAEPGEEGFGEQWDRLAWGNKERKEELKRQRWPEKYFESTEGVFCVWFSPWQHQDEPNPLIPLVREIRAQFEARFSKFPKRGKNQASQWRGNGLAAIKLLEQVTGAALSLSTGIPASALSEAVNVVRQGWQEKNRDASFAEPSDGQRFHLLFEDAVDQILTTFSGPPKTNQTEGSYPTLPRLILFIDDLDRCEEAIVVRLLEAIKLYLVSRRCVFVLGLDDSAVLDALTRYWQGRSEDSNREYLEKLFQATLAVPLPATSRVREAIAQQLDAHRIPEPERLAEDIERLLEPNPRKIKNFVNGFCAAWALHDAHGWLEEEAESKVRNSGELAVQEEHGRAIRRFLIFHYLRLYHRPVWRLLERQPESLTILYAVITQRDRTDPLESGMYPGEQRLLWEFYFRAFSHVLRNPGGEKGEERLLHGNESLDKAVERFQQRQDRKRSDEYLCQLFRELTADYELNPRYLYLHADDTPSSDT